MHRETRRERREFFASPPRRTADCADDTDGENKIREIRGQERRGKMNLADDNSRDSD
jgi:hypothetical protein